MTSFPESYDADYFATPIAAGTPVSLKIDGINLASFGFTLTNYPSNLLFPGVDNNVSMINFRHGHRHHNSRYTNWSFTLDGQISGLNHQDMLDRLDAFKQWLDLNQHHPLYTYIVHNQSIPALKLELTGHYHWYSKGGMTGTNGFFEVGNTLMNGETSEWTKFVKPGARLEIANQNPETIYTVTEVVGDQTLEISPALQTSVVSAYYRVETRRYLLVNLDGPSSREAINNRGFLSHDRLRATNTPFQQTTQGASVYNISLSFTTTYPFWIGDCVQFKQTSVTGSGSNGGTFYSIPNVGNSPSNPIYVIKGAATNPRITAGEMVLAGNFDGTGSNPTSVVDFKGTSVSTSLAASSAEFKVIERTGQTGILINDETMSMSGLLGNPDSFGFLVRFSPQADADAIGSDVYYFDFYDDTSFANAFRLFFDASDDDFVLNVRSGGVDNFTIRTTNPQLFDANNDIEVSGWFHPAGRRDPKNNILYYGKILVNGEIAGSVTSAPTTPAAKPQLGIIGGLLLSSGPVVAQNFANAIISKIGFFAYAPSDEELKRLYTLNRPLLSNSASLLVTTTLDANDILTITTKGQRDHITKWDASAGTESVIHAQSASTADTYTGNSPSFMPQNHHEEQVILVESTSATLNEFHTFYYPHHR